MRYFIKWRQYDNTKFTLDHFSSNVVHEICHFVENNRRTFPIINVEMSSYKFINEGYAEWIRAEYLDRKREYKIYSDNCAYHMLRSNLFELHDLNTIMFKYLNFPIYETATSFTFFLENRHGYDKLNAFWKSIPKYPQVHPWTDYLKLYSEEDLLDLMKEWKEMIIHNKGSKQSVQKEIITDFDIEHADNGNIIFHYTSKYPLWAGHNIFIYDNNMNLLMIDRVEKYRFLKDGHLKMKSVSSDILNITVYFLQYSQHFEYKMKEHFLLYGFHYYYTKTSHTSHIFPQIYTLISH